MNVQPLFLDQPLFGKEKSAGTVTALNDNADNWNRELLDAAYRQLPYLSDFDVNVILDKVDEERGYAFGSLEVQPKTDMATDELLKSPLNKVHVPVIIKEQMLSPFDVFVDGKAYHHLTEGRLRASLFRPDTFDAVRQSPPIASLYNNLLPPLGSRTGGGVKLSSAEKTASAKHIAGGALAASAALGGGAAAYSSGKKKGRRETYRQLRSAAKSHRKALTQGRIQGYMAGRRQGTEKKAAILPLLPQLHGRVHDDHIDRVKQAMLDPSIYSAVVNNDEGVQAAFASAFELEPRDPEKTAEAAWAQIKPDVVQVRKLDNGNFMMKWANHQLFAPQQEEVSPAVASEVIGDKDLVARVEEDGTITASPDAAVKETLDTEEIRTIDQYGLWQCQDLQGNTLVGWSFPQLLSFDLQPLPLTLFSNGSAYALQGTVAGKLVGKSTDIPKAIPKGFGCLYYIDHGNARAFVPMTIRNSFTGPAGNVSYIGSLETGEPIQFAFVEGLKSIAKTGENEYSVPANFSWMSLRGLVELQPEPLMFSKTSAATHLTDLEIRSDGAVYDVRGYPVEKIAHDDKAFIPRDQAEFLAVAAGVHPGYVKTAMDRASKGELVRLSGCRQIDTAKEKLAAARGEVRKDLTSLPHPIRNYNLIKEAAVLDDALTADKILGLGFLNAENVSTFVDMIPGLEFAASRVAEMLVASRLGLKDIPEIALERMMVAMEDVLKGLKKLKQQEISYVDDGRLI